METIKGFILLFAWLQWSNAAKNIPTFAGPYRVHVDKIIPCDGGPVSLNWTYAYHLSRFNPYKPNVKQIVTGNMTFTDTFDDTAWCDLRFALRANNEWKKNAFVMRFPTRACSTWRAEFPSFFFSLFKGVGHTGVCSIPPGTYPIADPVDWTFPKIKVFPYGFYLATLNSGLAGHKQPSCCIEFYSHFVPKAGE